MNIGSIGSGFGTFTLSAMRGSSRTSGSEDAEQRLSDLSSKIMEKKDSDGNGGISLEELDGLGIDEESFAAIDSDGDGLVNETELKEGLKRKQQELMSQIAEGLGMNSGSGGMQGLLEGALSMGGMGQSAPPPPPSEEQESQMLDEISSEIMDAADSDGDGSLSLEELNSLGIDEDGFAEIDGDGDGLVSQDELKADMTNKHEQQMAEAGSGGMENGSGTQGGGMFASHTLRRAMQQYASPEDAALGMLFGGQSGLSATA